MFESSEQRQRALENKRRALERLTSRQNVTASTQLGSSSLRKNLNNQDSHVINNATHSIPPTNVLQKTSPHTSSQSQSQTQTTCFSPKLKKKSAEETSQSNLWYSHVDSKSSSSIGKKPGISSSPRMKKRSEDFVNNFKSDETSSQNSFWHSPVPAESSPSGKKQSTSFSPRIKRKSIDSEINLANRNEASERITDVLHCTSPLRLSQSSSQTTSFSPRFRRKSSEDLSSQNSFWHSPTSPLVKKASTSFSPRMRKTPKDGDNTFNSTSNAVSSPIVCRSLFQPSAVCTTGEKVSTSTSTSKVTSKMTLDQQIRMEQNRLNALVSLKAKIQGSPSSDSNASVSTALHLSPSGQQRAEANKLKAMQKLMSKTNQQNSPSVKTLSPSAANLALKDCQRVEINKQKALEKLQNKTFSSQNVTPKSQNAPLKSQNAQYPPGYHSPPKQEIKIKFSVRTTIWFQVEHDLKFRRAIHQVVQKLEHKQYDVITGYWSMHIKDYGNVVDVFQQNLNVTIDHIPTRVVSILQKNHRESNICKSTEISAVGPCILEKLYPFQRKGVIFGVEKDGRVLIADDMGLGKTVQAIALTSYYKNDWPVLVICPSSVKMSWQQHFLTFIPDLPEASINIVFAGKDDPTVGAVNIISYDLASKLSEALNKKGFKVIVADESHLLKNNNAIRTKNIIPLLQKSKRAILLSGTPALSRPKELYTQILALNKYLFPGYFKFSERYCDAKKGVFGWDDTGCSNYDELNSVLKCTIMIRRLKEEVLQDLPPKRRNIIVLDPTLIKRTRDLMEAEKAFFTKTDRETAIKSYYQATAGAKIKGVCEFISEKLELSQKLVVFAHHQIMLDAIEEMVEKKNVVSIRIDGSTQSKSRQSYVDFFNNDESCLVAILSITAAGQGLTLTGSSVVIFAELYWNPGHLIQAEDRTHRIGQKNAVTVIYLIAKNTADDYIWEKVKNKLAVLTCLGIGKKRGLDAVAAIFTDPKQKRILQYFNELLSTEDGLYHGIEEDTLTDSQPPQKRKKTM